MLLGAPGIATRSILTTSNKKLLGTSASLLVTSALLLVTRSRLFRPRIGFLQISRVSEQGMPKEIRTACPVPVSIEKMIQQHTRLLSLTILSQYQKNCSTFLPFPFSLFLVAMASNLIEKKLVKNVSCFLYLQHTHHAPRPCHLPIVPPGGARSIERCPHAPDRPPGPVGAETDMPKETSILPMFAIFSVLCGFVCVFLGCQMRRVSEHAKYLSGSHLCL